DKNPWIASRLIWFDQPRSPDRSSDVPTSRSASRQLAQKMKPHRLLQNHDKWNILFVLYKGNKQPPQHLQWINE
ncbi:hypothetical protein STEG23_028787, partial [Scotinomys teguina]